MKIVINSCWGGFGVSQAVLKKLGMKKGDLILKVNETSVVNISQQDFKDIISSNKSVTFHLKRMAE